MCWVTSAKKSKGSKIWKLAPAKAEVALEGALTVESARQRKGPRVVPPRRDRHGR